MLKNNLIVFADGKNTSMQWEVVDLQQNYILNDKMTLCYPFIKWAGGKTQLLQQLYGLAPATFDRYFEPFIGGGALFFYLISAKNKRFTAYLSDINAELINSYMAVKDDVEKLIKLLRRQENGYKKASAGYYYKLRSNNNKFANHIEKAARFIALNRTCYNGLYRVNRQGIFNVPWGKYKDPLIYNSSNLRNVSLALRYSKAIINASDYKEILLENAKEGDFIYLDPPYNPVSSTAYFTRYTNSGFSDQNQKELADVFRELDERECKVLLSNSSTALVKELYSDFANNTTEVNALRSINCKGSRRAGHKELIIRNYS
jgi:DNA adenine methylase